jgi:hypothetical protein
VQVDPSEQVTQLGIAVGHELHVLALRKNPEEQALHVAPSWEQSEQPAMEVLQAAHEAPKKPALQAVQVVPSYEQAVHSATEVLQAAHEAPKKPVSHAVQVDPSEQVTQLGIAVGQELHVLELRKNPELQALHVAPSKLQSVQSVTEVLQAAHEAPKKPVLHAEQVPAKSQAVHSATEVLQAAHEVPKNPGLHAEQVPAKSQAVHSATEVLQAAQEAPKKPALQAEQVVPSYEQAVH